MHTSILSISTILAIVLFYFTAVSALPIISLSQIKKRYEPGQVDKLSFAQAISGKGLVKNQNPGQAPTGENSPSPQLSQGQGQGQQNLQGQSSTGQTPQGQNTKGQTSAAGQNSQEQNSKEQSPHGQFASFQNIQGQFATFQNIQGQNPDINPTDPDSQ